MTGHVFHPGHDELHGVTVVVAGNSGRTYVGRWHEQTGRGITMHDVAIHDPANNPLALEAWLARQRKFGVAVSEQHLIIRSDEAGEVLPLDQN